MDLIVMKMFKTVAESGSFLAASREIGYVQSGLSTRIQQLEDELGTQLFYRNNRGVSLTPKGELFLARANEILELAEKAAASMKDGDSPSGKLRIGTLQTISETSLPAVLAQYHKKFPDVELHIATGISAALVEGVLDRSLDVAFVAGNVVHPDLKTLDFVQEELCIAYSAGEDEITSLKNLCGKSLLVFPAGCSYRQMLENILRNEKLCPSHTIEFTSIGAIIAAASAGAGICLLPKSVLRQYERAKALKLYALPAKYGSVQTHLVYRKDAAWTPASREFVKMMTAP